MPGQRSAVPTRGLEPPHPYGQQILSLSRLPIPPRRHNLRHLQILAGLRTPDSVQTVICLTSEGGDS